MPDFGYVKGVETAGGVTRLRFDRATLYTGKAAQSAAKAAGTTAEDDYYISDVNPLIRTFVVSPSAVVLGSINLSGQVNPTPATIAQLTAYTAAHPKQPLPVDLSYDATGHVVKIAEVYFP